MRRLSRRSLLAPLGSGVAGLEFSEQARPGRTTSRDAPTRLHPRGANLLTSRPCGQVAQETIVSAVATTEVRGAPEAPAPLR